MQPATTSQPGSYEIREMPRAAIDPADRGTLVRAGLRFIEAHQLLMNYIAQGRDVYVTRMMEVGYGN